MALSEVGVVSAGELGWHSMLALRVQHLCAPTTPGTGRYWTQLAAAATSQLMHSAVAVHSRSVLLLLLLLLLLLAVGCAVVWCLHVVVPLCRFKRAVVPHDSQHSYNLNQSWHILLAIGPLKGSCSLSVTITMVTITMVTITVVTITMVTVTMVMSVVIQ